MPSFCCCSPLRGGASSACGRCHSKPSTHVPGATPPAEQEAAKPRYEAFTNRFCFFRAPQLGVRRCLEQQRGSILLQPRECPSKATAVSGTDIPGICSEQAGIKWRDVYDCWQRGQGAGEQPQPSQPGCPRQGTGLEYGEMESKPQFGFAQCFGHN